MLRTTALLTLTGILLALGLAEPAQAPTDQQGTTVSAASATAARVPAPSIRKDKE